MEAVENIIAMPEARRGKLLKVLGVGFGLAVAVGGTVGVGILRNPGGVAEQLGSPWLIVLAWTLGGIYCLLGANYTAELATMMPQAGGFYVYSERAFGRYGGFVVGWSDYLNGTLALGFISVVFGEYAAALFAPNLAGGRVIFSVSIIVILTIFNLFGVRAGSGIQKITSLLKAVALLAFVAACFVFGEQNNASATAETASVSTAGNSGLVAFVLAFQLIISTYDGWYSPIYFSEEDTDPAQNLPRSMFGGIVLVAAIYLLVNLALLYVLPMSQLAGAKFAGGDALSLILGKWSGQILTVLALLSLVGIMNALLMMQSRVMFGLGREGLFIKRAAVVNSGGTPVVALLIGTALIVILTSIGTFELLLGIATFFVVTFTLLTIIAFFVLRRRDADAPRPFRARFYPFAPALMLVIAALLLLSFIYSNPLPSLYALAVLALSYPIFRLTEKRI